MFSLKEYKEKNKKLPDYLPWAGLVGEGIVLQKDEVLQKTIQIRGHDLESSGQNTFEACARQLNHALKNMGKDWSYFIEVQRFEVDEYPKTHWAHKAAWVIDLERELKFTKDQQHFNSSYFITLVWKMPHSSVQITEKIFWDIEDTKTTDDNENDLAYFKQKCSEFIQAIKFVFHTVDELNDAQTLTYLHSTISTSRHSVRVPPIPMYLDAYLPDSALTAGDIPMLGEYFIPVATIRGFPDHTWPGILSELDHLNIEYRLVFRFITMDQNTARKELKKYKTRWWTKRKTIWTLLKEEFTKQDSIMVDNAAANQSIDADDALQSLSHMNYGYFSSTLIVWDQDVNRARDKINALSSVLQTQEFIVSPEISNGLQAWLGSLPGHIYANLRRPIINTMNLAHMMPLSSIWSGSTHNEHLLEKTGTGIAHITCSTTGQAIFRLNLNVGDVGHTMIAGATGAGKTTLLIMLALQWLKYPNAHVIFFDKGKTARAATLAVEGAYFEPGHADAPVSFQPLRNIHIKSERQFAIELIQAMVTLQGVTLNPELAQLIEQSINNLAESTPQHRSLLNLKDQIQNNTLRKALQPYCIDGTYGQIFDAIDETPLQNQWLCFEMAHLMKKNATALIPALMYLFHRIEQQLQGQPVLLIIDEAWLFLSHDVFASRLEEWLRTLRKKNVYVVFATQEVDDFAKSSIASTITMACATKILLPNPELQQTHVRESYARLGISDNVMNLLQKSTPKKHYFYASSQGQRLFDLNLGPSALALASYQDENDHKTLDQIERDNPPSQRAIAILKHKKAHWACTVLNKKTMTMETAS